MQDNFINGTAGESLLAGYLKSIGFSVAEPRPDSFGTDVVALNWCREDQLRIVPFFFQFKTHEDGVSQTVRKIQKKLLTLACQYPAFVVVTNGFFHKPRYWFCSLFSWMKRNTDWAITSGNEISIDPASFIEIRTESEKKSRLVEYLREDADRASTDAHSVWKPTFTPMTAMTVEDVFANVGRLSNIEPTGDLIRWAEQHSNYPGGLQLASRIREIRQTALISVKNSAGESKCDCIPGHWNCDHHSVGTTQESHELRKFFVRVDRMRRGEFARLPDYRWSQIAIWRVLFDIWPAAFKLVVDALSHPERWSKLKEPGKWSISEVKAGFGLASAMAHSTDQIMRDHATRALVRLADQVRLTDAASSQERYEFQHQLLFSLAQADEKYNARCAELLRIEGPRNSRELLLNRKYYQCKDDSALFKSISDKIRAPRVRDAHMGPVLEAQQELVLSRGRFSSSRN